MNPVGLLGDMMTTRRRRSRPIYAFTPASAWRGGGKVCARHKVAVKRVRRRIDGVGRKVTICPRCERVARDMLATREAR